MPTVRDIMEAIEVLAPSSHAMPDDRIGLQVGNPDASVTKVILSLDVTLGSVDAAVATGAQLLVSHHPLIWDPIQSIRTDGPRGLVFSRLLRNGISSLAAHTNWDCAPGGVNDALATALGLENVVSFGAGSEIRGWKLVAYCPPSYVDRLVSSLAEAGAGTIGLYRRCAFMSQGSGTFVGSKASKPFLGVPERRETVEEVRIEMFVPCECRGAVQETLLANHPYEQPAFDFLQRTDHGNSLGRLGELASPYSHEELLEHVDTSLETRSLCYSASGKLPVQCVAVVGGSGASLWREAQAAGADALVTGEVPHHVGCEASAEDFTILSSGHYATEQPGVHALAEAISSAVKNVAIEVFVPEPGEWGRPL